MTQKTIDTTTAQPNGKFGEPVKSAFEKVSENAEDAETRLAALESAADAESAARAAADTTLQTNINTEASARAAADTTLQTNINTEASARAAADTTLQTNINTEASARAAADTTLQTNITSLTSNVAPSSAAQNLVWATPISAAGAPVFRALVNADLPASGVTAGSYGSSSNTAGTAPVIPRVTVNAKGIVTAVSSTTLGTAASYGVGTSGAVVPLCSGANTWSGLQTIGLPNGATALIANNTSAPTQTSGTSNFGARIDSKSSLISSNLRASFQVRDIWNGDSYAQISCVSSSSVEYNYLFNQNGVATAVTWNSTSDARVKRNFVKLEDALDRIMLLTGYESWEQLTNPYGDVQNDVYITKAGVLAQDVELALPTAVSEISQGPAHDVDGNPISSVKNVDHGGLSALYVEAIKALYARLQVAEQRLAALEASGS